ncbi:MAG: trypsin-like peptidase domain-containing protein [Nitrososphaerales archaeon]|nr:trypsin-like peptidase domain-containing protein [Nitrososphaerales archaeon]
MGTLCIIAIAISSVNSYLIFTDSEQNTQIDLDETKRKIDSIESSLSSLSEQLSTVLDNSESLNTLNQTVLSEISVLESKFALQTDELTRNLTQTRESLRQISLIKVQDDNEEILSTISKLSSSIEEMISTIGVINSNLDALSENVQLLEEKVSKTITQTPIDVFEIASKSVVVIRTDQGQGSGFMYSINSSTTTNLIVTNWHVVEDASEIEVEFYDKSRINAVIVGEDAYSDIAVIRVPTSPSDSTPLKLGNSSNLYIGQQLVAIGNPLGLTQSLSSGFVSQVNRQIELDEVPIIVPVLQIDLTIAPGSSGGPLFDLSANVVGITNAGTTNAGKDVGFNFAVPSNIVNRVVPALIQQGKYIHPLFGFYAIPLTPEDIQSRNVLNVDTTQTGLMVIEITPGFPAENVGLTAGIDTEDQEGNEGYIAIDIIMEIDGIQVIDWSDWSTYVAEFVSPGQTVTFTIWRSGEIILLDVTATNREEFR